MNNTLYIVVPCYNEEEMLPISAPVFKNKIESLIKEKSICENSKVLLVNDGSKDKTWDIIENLCKESNVFAGIKLSRNQGHQNALMAGLSVAKEYADMAVTIDADLQDDINAIDKMVQKFNEGNEVVYGVRSSRKTDTAFKRMTAQGFYKMMGLMGVDIVYNHADFRLLSKRAIEYLEQFKEVNLFLRGIVPLLGFKSDVVEYVRNEREAGESKYPLKKMLAFAFDGITSFSIKPIRMVTAVGIIGFIVAIIFAIYSLVGYAMHKTVSGWTSTILSVWLFGSLQLMATGIIGEYIGKVYLETKSRPRYFIERLILNEKEDKD